jgi:regulator of sigma E protease
VSYLLAFAGFAFLIVAHEWGHFIAAKKTGMRAERFSLFFPPHIWKKQVGETEYAVGSIPLGGYVRITGMNPNEEVPEEVRDRAYFRMPVWKRIVVISAGPLMNILIAFAIFVGLFLALGVTTGSTRVDQIERGAAAAGVLQPGDRLVAVDGVRGDARALGAQISTHECAGTPTDGCRAATPAKVTVERDGAERTLSVYPRYDAERGRPRLGFSFAVDTQNVGPVEAARLSGEEMWRVSTATVSAITRLVYDSEARKEVSGVVGSYEVTRQSIEFDWARALNVLAIISLSLALVNLFPFLPLDGGHIFWALAEKLRGRPIPYSVMERASVVGFVLIVMLFAVGLTNDIGRLTGDGFQVR